MEPVFDVTSYLVFGNFETLCNKGLQAEKSKNVALMCLLLITIFYLQAAPPTVPAPVEKPKEREIQRPSSVSRVPGKFKLLL